jgi:hypothetical protein
MELLCSWRQAAHLGRNAIRASWDNVFWRNGDERERPAREPLRGLIMRFDMLDAAELLDIADYVACAFSEVEELMLLIYDS